MRRHVSDDLDRRRASFDFAQDEGRSYCHRAMPSVTFFILSEVEGRTMLLQRIAAAPAAIDEARGAIAPLAIAASEPQLTPS
jgi:hypothetical protein